MGFSLYLLSLRFCLGSLGFYFPGGRGVLSLSFSFFSVKMLAEDVSPDGQRRSDWSLEAFMPNMTSDLPNPFPEDITLEEARQAILVQPGERDFEEGVKKPFPGFRECRKGDCVCRPPVVASAAP